MQFTPSLESLQHGIHSFTHRIFALIEDSRTWWIGPDTGYRPGCKSPKHKPNANIYGKLTWNYQQTWNYVIAAKGHPKGGIGGTALYVKLLHAECAAYIISTKEPPS